LVLAHPSRSAASPIASEHQRNGEERAERELELRRSLEDAIQLFFGLVATCGSYYDCSAGTPRERRTDEHGDHGN